MKLKQLQCVLAVYEHGFSVTHASRALHLSQPAVSKYIKSLEEQLNSPIFTRGSKSLLGLTDFGQEIMPLVVEMLKLGDEIVQCSAQKLAQQDGVMYFATTNTLATYRLTPMMGEIQTHYPKVPVHVVEGTNAQILQLLNEREVDIGWISAADLLDYQPYLHDLCYLQASSWSSILLVPKEHVLAREKVRSLAQICAYPLITYVTSFKGQSSLVRYLQAQKLTANVVLTARSSEMIKSYVRQGLGVGVIADMAYDEQADKDLVAIDLSAWLPDYQTYLLWHRLKRLKSYHLFTIRRIIPTLTEGQIKRAMLQLPTNEGWVI